MFHQQNLQIRGIAIQGTRKFPCEDDTLFRMMRLRFAPKDISVEPVPIKLPVVPRKMTPYSLVNGALHYEGEPLRFQNLVIERVPMVAEENPWHMKGYTFPFQGTRNPFRELRLNLCISGYCPGRCFFCHRWHSHRVKPTKRYQPSPDEVLDRLGEIDGPEILGQVQQIVFISELFGHEGKFLTSVGEVRAILEQRGFDRSKTFGCCAQDVRSAAGLKTLLELLQPARYSFSLEMFDHREELMGPYKGLSMEKVYTILSTARKVGLKEIQINYLAGIDSLESGCHGFEELAQRGLVDSVGFSTYTTFSEKQMGYRHPEAWQPTYYKEFARHFSSLDIKVYRPESFDFGSPYTVLMEKID